jgi:serine/threonine-protein kinase RsbW
MMPVDRNQLFLNADFAAVRDTLCRLFPQSADADQDSRAVAELVLAEVLNNVVEHAYGGAGGPIHLTLRQCHDCLSFRVADAGQPYPARGLPSGTVSAVAVAQEGGFGWGLIRALATGVAYRRVGQMNVLVFRVALNNGAQLP